MRNKNKFVCSVIFVLCLCFFCIQRTSAEESDDLEKAQEEIVKDENELSFEISLEDNGYYEYRKYYQKEVVLEVNIKKNHINDSEEKYDYTVETSNQNVIQLLNDNQTFEETVKQIPLRITGVGKAMIQVTLQDAEKRILEEKHILVEVINSKLENSDFQVRYKENNGNEVMFDDFQAWISFLKERNHWLNGIVSIQISDKVKDLYQSIGYRFQDEMCDNSISLDDEQQTQDVFVWLINEKTNANTKLVEDGINQFFLGIDKTKPFMSNLEYAKDYFAETKTEHKVFFGKDVQITGVASDELSGIQKIEYCFDARNAEHAEWMELEKTWEEGAKDVGFSLVLSQGKYPAIAFRITDVSGNISELIKVSENGTDFQEIIVDSKEPDLQITAISNGVSYCGDWTNQKIVLHANGNEKDNHRAGIWKIYYQFVKIGEEYNPDQWLLFEEQDIEIGKDKNENMNGYYYFKAISESGIETSYEMQQKRCVRIKLQQKMTTPKPMLEMKPEQTGKNGWYNKATKVPYVSFAYPEYEDGIDSKEYAAPVYVHANIEVIDEKGSKRAIEQSVEIGINSDDEYQALLEQNRRYLVADNIEKLDVDFGYDKETGYANDGIYQLTYWLSDKAGNETEKEIREYKIDTHEPTNINILVDGKTISMEKQREIIYREFYNECVTGTVKTDYGISGKETFQLYQITNIDQGKSGKKVALEHDSFRLFPGTRCGFYGMAEDGAGNIAEIYADGVVVDNEEPSICLPNDKNDYFYRDDVDVEIQIKDFPRDDNYAGLEEIKCRIGVTNETEKVTMEKILFSSPKVNVLQKDLEASGDLETHETISAKENESNDAFIEIIARDRSGNTKTTRKNLHIDITKPEIEINFNSQDTYFSKDTIAKICIKELNFDPDLVEVDIIKDGKETKMPLLEWKHQGLFHEADLVFSEDGVYSFTVNVVDKANNKAEEAKTGEFIIDKTKPLIDISYNHNLEYMKGYYSKERVATVTITEQNFDEENISIVSDNALRFSNWKHIDDKHIATIEMNTDGDYKYRITCSDLAGNEMNEMPYEDFTIDRENPQIKILGIENNSANKGDIYPVIHISDCNILDEETQIDVINGSGKSIVVNFIKEKIENELYFRLSNVSDQEDDIYFLTVSAMDKAGNKEKLTYRYSLNRYGSTYNLRAMNRIINQKYINYDDLEDIVITEMNVDPIDRYEIYISQNGKFLKSTNDKTRMRKDEVFYQVKEEGNGKVGYCNTYTIFKENFKEEGLYNITIYSKDRAGNEVNNTLEGKEAKIQFVIDNTAPKVVIDGIESNKIYKGKSICVNVLVLDNVGLRNATFSLINEKGECIKTWDYLKNTQEGESVMLEIPESDQLLSLSYEITDMAGNTTKIIDDKNQVPKNFIVSTNTLFRCIHSKYVRIIGGLVLVSFIGAVIFLERKK